MLLPAGISLYASAIIAVLLYFSDSNHAITVLAPGQDVYVLVTLRNDTTFSEFKEMISFYLDIQASCPNCTPPISNLPCLMFFGEIQEDFTQSLNVTASITDIMKSEYFKDVLFSKSLSAATSGPTCTQNCVEMEFFLDYIAVNITRMMDSMETRLRKKKVTIITNYYYPYVAYHLNQTRIPGFNVTYINYFVPNADVLDTDKIYSWPFPVQIFSCALSDIAPSSQLYLDQYIDFTPDPSLTPITGFIDIGYYNLLTALGFFNVVFNQGLCKYTSGLQYYEVRFLVHYSGFHVENIVLIPFLGSYTATYFTTVVPYLIDNLLNNIGATHPLPDDTPEDYKKIDETATSCEAAFYDAFVARVQLKSDADGKPLFTFFVSDAMPSCAVKGLQSKGVSIGSYLNHVEIILHITDGASDITPSNVYEEVTNVIFDKKNATKKGNHVYVTDLTKPGSIDLLGICSSQVSSVYASKAVKISESPAKRFKWEIIGGCLAAVTVFTGIFVTVYVKRVKIRRWRRDFLQRHKQNSSGSTSRNATFRFATDLAAASRVIAGLSVEEDPTFRLWRISPDSLKIESNEVLGRGSSATIYSGFLTDMSPLARLHPRIETTRYEACPVAIKTSLAFGAHNDEALANELTTLLKLEWHPNICAFLGWSVARDKQCLVFEKAESDLLKYSQSFRDNGIPPLRNVLSMLWQLSNAMVYLASLKLVHRDLAARNVFLTSDFTVKLGDFGLCCECNQTDTYTASITKRLPIKWLSPEAILDRLFSEASDVWSFGVIIFEIYSGGIVPYGTMSNEEMVDFIRTGKRLPAPEDTPKELQKIMSSCWQEVVDDRPSFDDLRSVLHGLLEGETQHYGYLSHDQVVV